MSSQSLSTSFPRHASEAGALHEKAGTGNPGRTVTEKPEDQNDKAHASKPPTNRCKNFLSLPREIRNIIYSYVLAVDDYFSDGISRGVICLADKPGFPPKLCSLAYMHNSYQHNDDYLTEDYELFKPFISREAEAWRIEINQIKYVCKQLHCETRGITLKINSGRKLMFHGTKTSGSSGMANWIFQDTGRISGMANFVHFYRKCSPEQQEHIRNVDIIELPLKDEQPRPDHSLQRNDRGGGSVAVASRTWVEHIMALELRKAFIPRPLSPEEIEKRSFRRRCAELTGGRDAASKHLYKICQLNPSIRVIVRYNELQDSVGREWIKRMCAYRMALRRDMGGFTVSNQEMDRIHELVLRNGGAATSPSLDNLRMSSSVNFSVAGSHPCSYFMDVRTVWMAHHNQTQRIRESETLFEEGV